MLEDFFFAQFSERLSLELHGGYQGPFRFDLGGLSFDGFSTNASGEKSPLRACCITAVGHFTGFFGPSAPYTVATKQEGIFAASEQLTLWGTIFYSRQN